ncbi:HD domain-containing protein [soil metagenome]
MSAETSIRMSELISALSYALDITEGQTEGHAVRSCLIGMRIASALTLSAEERSDLFYALLLKDAGCSSNSARTTQLFGASDLAVKRTWKLVDWADSREAALHTFRNVSPGRSGLFRALHTLSFATKGEVGTELVQTRCERGAEIASMLGFSARTANAIRALDEHWDGAGKPYGLAGDEIPLFGRILCLAQTADVFATEISPAAALDMAHTRSGTWFDPLLARTFTEVCDDVAFWESVFSADVAASLALVEPEDRVRMTDEEGVDRVAEAFARIIDAKSPYTFRHSEGVAAAAHVIGTHLGFDATSLRELRRAALLHDIGKLGVPNSILDKPAKLTEDEFGIVRRHTVFTETILTRVSCFAPIASMAASHHERMDGHGYHRGVEAGTLTTAARALAVADVFDALSAERPYRGALPLDQVLGIMRNDAGTGLCRSCLTALEDRAEGLAPPVRAAD